MRYVDIPCWPFVVAVVVVAAVVVVVANVLDVFVVIATDADSL